MLSFVWNKTSKIAGNEDRIKNILTGKQNGDENKIT